MPVTAGTLTFNSSSAVHDSRIAGDHAASLPGHAAIEVLDGSHEISANLVLAANTDVTVSNAADTLTLSGNISGPGMG